MSPRKPVTSAPMVMPINVFEMKSATRGGVEKPDCSSEGRRKGKKNDPSPDVSLSGPEGSAADPYFERGNEGTLATLTGPEIAAAEIPCGDYDWDDESDPLRVGLVIPIGGIRSRSTFR